MKRFFKWSLIIGCVAFGAWTIWNLWATSRLEKVVEELRERGLATTIADLEVGLPPFDSQPAETENAAPILSAAFALAGSIEPLHDFFARDGSETPEQVREGLPRFEEVFDLLYRAAERPRCRFDLRWSDGYSMMLAHVSEMRRVSRLLQARAMARSADGNVEGAIEDTRVIFGLARCMREEPILVTQLMRIAVSEMGLEALEVILPRTQSAVAALERTTPDDAAGSMARAFQGELVMSLTIGVDSRAWEVLADADSQFDSTFSQLALPYVKADVAYMAKLLGRCVEMAGKPYPTVLSLVDSLSEEVHENGGMMTKMFLPSTTRVFRSEARHAARVALARLAARCIDHQREHGEYPSRLADLKDVELDPLTGGPFVLETRPDGILLRSDASEETAGGEIAWELGGR